MHFSATIDYPADVGTVAEMLADDEFVRRKIEASKALEGSHDVYRDGAAFTVTTRRTMPTDEMPARFRSLVGQSLEVRLVEAWQEPGPDGTRRGTLSLDIVGAPVRVTGALGLAPAARGATQSFAGEVTASVPLFGGPIEKAAVGAVQRVVDEERRVGMAYLTEHGHV